MFLFRLPRDSTHPIRMSSRKGGNMGEPHGATQVLTWSVTICSQSQHTAAGEVSCWSYVGPTTNTWTMGTDNIVANCFE